VPNCFSLDGEKYNNVFTPIFTLDMTPTTLNCLFLIVGGNLFLNQKMLQVDGMVHMVLRVEKLMMELIYGRSLSKIP
jgi:hypothetical protein